MNTQELTAIVQKYAKQNGLDPELVLKIIAAESSNNPEAVSPVGAQGLMQLMPDTAAQYGVTDPFDPDQNISGGTKHLAELLKFYGGDVRKALAAHNWGRGNLDKGGPWPQETQNFVTKIAGPEPSPTPAPFDPSQVDPTPAPIATPIPRQGPTYEQVTADPNFGKYSPEDQTDILTRLVGPEAAMKHSQATGPMIGPATTPMTPDLPLIPEAGARVLEWLGLNKPVDAMIGKGPETTFSPKLPIEETLTERPLGEGDVAQVGRGLLKTAMAGLAPQMATGVAVGSASTPLAVKHLLATLGLGGIGAGVGELAVGKLGEATGYPELGKFAGEAAGMFAGGALGSTIAPAPPTANTAGLSSDLAGRVLDAIMSKRMKITAPRPDWEGYGVPPEIIEALRLQTADRENIIRRGPVRGVQTPSDEVAEVPPSAQRLVKTPQEVAVENSITSMVQPQAPPQPVVPGTAVAGTLVPSTGGAPVLPADQAAAQNVIELIRSHLAQANNAAPPPTPQTPEQEALAAERMKLADRGPVRGVVPVEGAPEETTVTPARPAEPVAEPTRGRVLPVEAPPPEPRMIVTPQEAAARPTDLNLAPSEAPAVTPEVGTGPGRPEAPGQPLTLPADEAASKDFLQMLQRSIASARNADITTEAPSPENAAPESLAASSTSPTEIATSTPPETAPESLAVSSPTATPETTSTVRIGSRDYKVGDLIGEGPYAGRYLTDIDNGKVAGISKSKPKVVDTAAVSAQNKPVEVSENPSWTKGRYTRFGGDELVTVSRNAPKEAGDALRPYDHVWIGEHTQPAYGEKLIRTQVPARELIAGDEAGANPTPNLRQGTEARWVPVGYDPGEARFSGREGKNKTYRETYPDAQEIDTDLSLAEGVPAELSMEAKAVMEQLPPAEREIIHRELERARSTDVLTGLQNKKGWIALAKTLGPEDHAVVMDMSGFSEINNTHGHKVGDVLLAVVGQKVQKHLGSDTSRFGGDEFGGVIRGKSLEEAQQMVSALEADLNSTYINIRMPDGNIKRIKPLEVHIGLAKDTEAADLASNDHRAKYGSGRRKSDPNPTPGPTDSSSLPSTNKGAEGSTGRGGSGDQGELDDSGISKSEVKPYIYGAGTRLSEAYTKGRDGLPLPKFLSDKTSTGYKAWKTGHDEWEASGKQPFNSDDSGISKMAEISPGKAVGVTQPRLIRELGANLYSGDLGQVVVKEGLQNAVDAIPKGTVGNLTVKVDTKDKTFDIRDDGIGMLPEVVKNQFLDPGGTYKPEGGRGGYGIAKVALLSQADKILVRSIARVPQAQSGGSAEFSPLSQWLEVMAKSAEKNEDYNHEVFYDELSKMDWSSSPDKVELDQKIKQASDNLIKRNGLDPENAADPEWTYTIKDVRDDILNQIETRLAKQRKIEGNASSSYPGMEGKLIETVLEGDGERWLDPNNPMDVVTKEVPEGSPTGTRVYIKLNEGASVNDYSVRGYLQNFLTKQKLGHNFNIELDGKPIPKPMDFDAETGKYVEKPSTTMLTEKKMPGANVQIWTGKNLRETDYVSVHVLNDGLPQFNMSVDLRGRAKFPTDIEVNVIPKVDTTDPNYPFTPNRQQLRDQVKDYVEDFISHKLYSEGVRQEQELYKEALKNKAPVPYTRVSVLETTGSVTPETLKEVAESPQIQRIALLTAQVVRRAAAAIVKSPVHKTHDKAVFAPNIFGTDLGYSGGKWYGVNLDTGRVYGKIDEASGELSRTGQKQYSILVDPWAIVELVDSNLGVEDQAEIFGRETWATAVHELMHNKHRQHDEDFSGWLTHWLPHTIKEGSSLIRSFKKEVQDDPEFFTKLREQGKRLGEEFSNTKRKDVLGAITVKSESGDGQHRGRDLEGSTGGGVPEGSPGSSTGESEGEGEQATTGGASTTEKSITPVRMIDAIRKLRNSIKIPIDPTDKKPIKFWNNNYPRARMILDRIINYSKGPNSHLNTSIADLRHTLPDLRKTDPDAADRIQVFLDYTDQLGEDNFCRSLRPTEFPKIPSGQQTKVKLWAQMAKDDGLTHPEGRAAYAVNRSLNASNPDRHKDGVLGHMRSTRESTAVKWAEQYKNGTNLTRTEDSYQADMLGLTKEQFVELKDKPKDEFIAEGEAEDLQGLADTYGFSYSKVGDSLKGKILKPGAELKPNQVFDRLMQKFTVPELKSYFGTLTGDSKADEGQFEKIDAKIHDVFPGDEQQAWQEFLSYPENVSEKGDENLDVYKLFVKYLKKNPASTLRLKQPTSGAAK